MPRVAAPRRSALEASTLQRSFWAQSPPSRSLTWMYVGMNAALNEPLITAVAREGTTKAIRNASMASPVPKDAATASSFTLETSFAAKVSEAITRVALNILRFVERFDHRVHCFAASTQNLTPFSHGRQYSRYGRALPRTLAGVVSLPTPFLSS